MVKKIFVNILRTSIAFIIISVLFLFSGKIFNFMPAIILVPLIVFYFSTGICWYFVIAADDILSTILGILIGIIFAASWVINITMVETLFTKGLFVIGILLGIAQIIKCAGLRFKFIDYN